MRTKLKSRIKTVYHISQIPEGFVCTYGQSDKIRTKISQECGSFGMRCFKFADGIVPRGKKVYIHKDDLEKVTNFFRQKSTGGPKQLHPRKKHRLSNKPKQLDLFTLDKKPLRHIPSPVSKQDLSGVVAQLNEINSTLKQMLAVWK